MYRGMGTQREESGLDLGERGEVIREGGNFDVRTRKGDWVAGGFDGGGGGRNYRGGMGEEGNGDLMGGITGGGWRGTRCATPFVLGITQSVIFGVGLFKGTVA